MKGTKLFKNARLKGQKELVSILVEDGIINKISADIPHEKSTGCEEVDLNGQLVIPPYVDPHYILTMYLRQILVRKTDPELFLKESSDGVNQKETCLSNR